MPAAHRPFASGWTRIIALACHGALVRLEAPGARVEVGRHVWPGRRWQLADALRLGLGAEA
jgi:hypothetical protein